MAKKSIETKIRLNVTLICLLVALVCGSVFFYFYVSSKSIDLKRKTVEEYNRELIQINELINAVNEAQASVNLFVVTKNRRHLTQYQERIGNVNLMIDSLRTNREELVVDTILLEMSQLLKLKEQSILLLNRQFKTNSPIDSLSQKLADLSGAIDSLTMGYSSPLPEVVVPQGGLWDELIRVFSSSKQNESSTSSIVLPFKNDTDRIVMKDSLQINQIIEQTRKNYDRHLSVIENQINSIILADQNITTRITELFTMLYRQIIFSRIEEINEDEALLRKSNMNALVFGGIALFLILGSIVLVLHYVNKGFAARQALERANERTRRLMESRHKLLLSVSHDVKTPLNSILGYVDLYYREGILTAEEVGPIHHSGSHILSLLGNLLEFSSLEKGSVSLVSGNFSLRDLCTELCEMFAPLAERKGLNFNCSQDFMPELILYSDSLKIKQIVVNLLSNAIKYTMEQGVTFKAAYQENKLEFQVIDTGVGIPADKQKALFKPFSRIAENNMLDEGNGFGLYVVKGLVGLFEGEINIQSEQGKGTTVTMKLPVPMGEKLAVDQSAKRILIVDDDEVYMRLLSGFCLELGHTAVMCKDVTEFAAALKEINVYDCVLTDMEMGDFNGKDVLKKVRAQHKELPVILITGRVDYNPEVTLSEGFTDYLAKPVTLFSLHALIGGKINEEKANNLVDFLGQDKEAFVAIMERFFMETVNHIVCLNDAVKDRDLKKAQYYCHKMLPMFIQTGAPESIIVILRLVEETIIQQDGPNEEIWQKITLLVDQLEQFLQKLQEDYLSD